MQHTSLGVLTLRDDEQENGSRVSEEVDAILKRSKLLSKEFQQLIALAEQTSNSQRRPTQDAGQAAEGRRPRNVLLIDDSLQDVLLVREALEHSPVEVTLQVAFDGPHGILAIEEFQPDLILLDLNLPGLNGFDVLKHCQLVPAQVIVFTSSDTHSDRSRALSLGAADFVTKPSDLPRFKEAVHEIVADFLAAD